MDWRYVTLMYLGLMMDQLMIWKEIRDLRTVSRSVLGTCGELDALVSIPDEGDMVFLWKKVKSGAAAGKLLLL
ncbi:hypothetical protein Tco_0519561 [Tanacetum coccineum]